MVLHVRYKSLYISLPSSAKQQREMTNCAICLKNENYDDKCFKILFQIYCGVPDSVRDSFDSDKQT